MDEVLEQAHGPAGPLRRRRAHATGSAGTIAGGDYLKKLFPGSKVVATEALQCPTLLRTASAATASRASATSTCPGSTTCSNTDMVRHRRRGRDRPDAPLQRAGRPAVPRRAGRPGGLSAGSSCSGSRASPICSRPSRPPSTTSWASTTSSSPCSPTPWSCTAAPARAAPRAGRVHRGRRGCRLPPLPARRRQPTTWRARAIRDRRRIHNLKYYTWVEQQGKTYEEIKAQWFDETYWSGHPGQTAQLDALIAEFNARTGLAQGTLEPLGADPFSPRRRRHDRARSSSQTEK